LPHAPGGCGQQTPDLPCASDLDDLDAEDKRLRLRYEKARTPEARVHRRAEAGPVFPRLAAISVS
jgi:hypothetical protein